MRSTGTMTRTLQALGIIPLLILLCGAQPVRGAPQPDASLVDRTLALELRNARDFAHPMRYLLQKSSPRLATTKAIIETRDGAVARLLSVNGKPLSGPDEQREQARLRALLESPDSQRSRKRREDADVSRALKVLRALPLAFRYQYAGSIEGANGPLDRFTFSPNPAYDPPDLETQVLTAMAGEIWIDPGHERVVRLEGRLQRDVNIGWGILAHLNKGGWIQIDQAEVTPGRWRVVRFQMQMDGRVFFKSKSFDTLEQESGFAPVAANLTYVQAIRMLGDDPPALHLAER
ncbi:MAG TPA: hypothetical protein VFU68_03840 [Terracidiphilus sp.]|nr:hypothetical protein [Terracidiphilus sp.]